MLLIDIYNFNNINVFNENFLVIGLHCKSLSERVQYIFGPKSVTLREHSQSLDAYIYSHQSLTPTRA